MSQVRILSSRPYSCGRSSMVEPQPSKLMTRVRFPSPAPRNLQVRSGNAFGLFFSRNEQSQNKLKNVPLVLHALSLGQFVERGALPWLFWWYSLLVPSFGATTLMNRAEATLPMTDKSREPLEHTPRVALLFLTRLYLRLRFVCNGFALFWLRPRAYGLATSCSRKVISVMSRHCPQVVSLAFFLAVLLPKVFSIL